MKRDEKQQLKQKSVAELEALIKESKEKLRGLTFDLAAGKVKNVGTLRSLKKDIARMLTYIRHNAR